MHGKENHASSLFMLVLIWQLSRKLVSWMLILYCNLTAYAFSLRLFVTVWPRNRILGSKPVSSAAVKNSRIKSGIGCLDRGIRVPSEQGYSDFCSRAGWDYCNMKEGRKALREKKCRYIFNYGVSRRRFSFRGVTWLRITWGMTLNGKRVRVLQKVILAYSK